MFITRVTAEFEAAMEAEREAEQGYESCGEAGYGEAGHGEASGADDQGDSGEASADATDSGDADLGDADADLGDADAAAGGKRCLKGDDGGDGPEVEHEEYEDDREAFDFTPSMDEQVIIDEITDHVADIKKWKRMSAYYI